MNTSKTKIQKAFSRASEGYDEFCGFHTEVAERLINKIPFSIKPDNVLDVGMGTGTLTKKLKDKFPKAMVVGLDLATGMIEVAREKLSLSSLVQADTARLPFQKNVFDLIVSNLSYQWEYDLRTAFGQCRSSLKDNGRICFSLFGQNTFKELFTSLEEALKLVSPNKKFFTDKLADEKEILNAVSFVGFKDITVESVIHRYFFDDMLDMLRWIKGIGGNTLNRSYYPGKELLLKTNEYYSRNFKGNSKVFATFEVVWVEARK